MNKPNKTHINILHKKSVCIKFVEGNFISYKNKEISCFLVGGQIRGLIPKFFDKLNNIFQPQEYISIKNLGFAWDTM